MTNKDKTTHKKVHQSFDFEACMGMMAQMTSSSGKQEEMADFCSEMMSGFADIEGSDSDLGEMMSQMIGSCFGKTYESGNASKNI
jgi:hypothetical protein